MQYCCSLLVTRDMPRARAFYEQVLGLRVTADFGANITFENAFALQTLETWAGFIEKEQKDIAFGGMNAELYFETEDLQRVQANLDAHGVSYLHRIKEHPWGQRVIRFFDPDRHVIEVGEDMAMVCKRFLDAGMSVEEVAHKTMYLPEFIRSLQ